MKRIEIGCFCGKEMETEIEARHDFLMDCEDMQTEMMTCPDCGARYRVWIGVSVEDFGKETK